MSLFRTPGKCLMSTFLLSYFPPFYYHESPIGESWTFNPRNNEP